MSKVALICGVTGQDGSYLARLLLSKGYTVVGTSRDAFNTNVKNLKLLGIDEQVNLISMDVKDFRSVYTVITKVEPDEIYYLSGQSSVGLSFELPSETLESIVLGTLNLLEICRISQRPIRLYHAGSSECFGDTTQPATEESPFYPKSPYAVAKSSSFWLVNNYREAYGLYACTGILFNHESPLRGEGFVTQKIIAGAKAISEGKQQHLILGKLDIVRDWGWSAEYVEAMWLMLQQDKPQDYIVATGKSHRLETFIKYVFDYHGLDWKKYVIESQAYYRPSDILTSYANPTLIRNNLGWEAKIDLSIVIKKMIEKQLF